MSYDRERCNSSVPLDSAVWNESQRQNTTRICRELSRLMNGSVGCSPPMTNSRKCLQGQTDLFSRVNIDVSLSCGAENPRRLSTAAGVRPTANLKVRSFSSAFADCTRKFDGNNNFPRTHSELTVLLGWQAVPRSSFAISAFPPLFHSEPIESHAPAGAARKAALSEETSLFVQLPQCFRRSETRRRSVAFAAICANRWRSQPTKDRSLSAAWAVEVRQRVR